MREREIAPTLETVVKINAVNEKYQQSKFECASQRNRTSFWVRPEAAACFHVGWRIQLLGLGLKRFTETNKWRDPWYRKLSPIAKLLWSYLTDHCDCVGLIDPDMEAAAFDIGSPIEEKHLAELESRTQRLENGKIFIPKFILFQYGTLSKTCPAHNPIFKAIERHSLILTDMGYLYPTDRLSIAHKNGIEKEKEEEKEKETVKFVSANVNDGQSQSHAKPPRPVKEPKPTPSLEEVKLCCAKSGLPDSDAVWFWNKCEANGWTNGGRKILSWPHTVASWKAAGYFPSQKPVASSGYQRPHEKSLVDKMIEQI